MAVSDDDYDLSLFDYEDVFDGFDFDMKGPAETRSSIDNAFLSHQVAPTSKTGLPRSATESLLLQQLQELIAPPVHDGSSFSSSDTLSDPQFEEEDCSEENFLSDRQGQRRAKRPRTSRGGASQPRRKPVRLLLWRKYGQKHLKGDQKGLVRCYYRCHDPQCPAKRFIEKPASDLSQILEVRHEGAHNHPVSPEFDDLEPV